MFSFLRYLCLSTLFFSTHLLACSADAYFGPTDDVHFNDVIVQRDTPVGTVIASVAGEMSGGEYYYGITDCDIYVAMNYQGAVPAPIEHVYNTNVPGVGIRFYFSTWSHGGVYASPTPGTFLDHFSTAMSYGINPPVVDLIKTGNITSGSLATGSVAHVYALNNENTNGDVTWSINSPAVITQVACAINSGPLSFSIGNVLSAQFISTGTVSQEVKTVDLKLDCDPEANINFTLTGVQNPDSSDSSILALTGQGQDDAKIADGIGVQLLYNDKPLKLNERLEIKHSAGGNEIFPITARYIQTKDKIKAGIANTTATLNLTYQ